MGREVPRDWYRIVFHGAFMRGPFKKISGHGTIPIIIGAAVVAEGHSQMLVRSIAVVVCAAWLGLDVGVWVSEYNWRRQFKAIVFCLASCILGCSAMGFMYYFLFSTLEDQRNETYQNLTASHSIPPGRGGDPMHTMFTVTNGSKNEISVKHEITCLTNYAVSNEIPGDSPIESRSSSIKNVMSAVVGQSIVMGHPVGWLHHLASAPLEPGGDAQTEECLAFFNFGMGTKCVDMTLIFWYSLESQAELEQEKKFRFVALKEENQLFEWYTEPTKRQGDYCTDLLTRERNFR